jgi:hypothetical protein
LTSDCSLPCGKRTLGMPIAILTPVSIQIQFVERRHGEAGKSSRQKAL